MTRRLSFNQSDIWRFIRFAIVGAGSALLYAIVTWASVHFFNINPPRASDIGYLVSIPVNFIGQRNFTFASAGSKRIEFIKFCLVHAFNLTLAHVVMWAVTEQFLWHYLWGIAFIIIVIPLCSYFWLLVFVFASPKSKE